MHSQQISGYNHAVSPQSWRRLVCAPEHIRLLCVRIFGPVYAFKRYVNEKAQGNNVTPLKLRSHDELQELEEVASKIDEMLKDKAS